MLKSITFAFLFINLSNSEKLRCPLVWTPLTIGFSIDEKTVPSQIGELYIARGKIQNDPEYTIGRISIDESNRLRAYFPKDSLQVELFTFDILTNPHGCNLEWRNEHGFLNIGKTEFNVTVDDLGRSIVGRIKSGKDNYFIGGKVKKPTIHYAVDGRGENSMGFQVLISTSDGLAMRLSDFVFDGEMPEGNLDLMGMDEIQNESPVEVTHVVTHRKMFSESYYFSESSFSQTYIQESSSWGFYLPELFGIPISIDFLKESSAQLDGVGKFNCIFNKTEKEMVVTRTVKVPPYTSMQLCSTISTNENFEVDYIAKGTWTIPGWSALEVLKYVYEKGWIELEAEGEGVVGQVEGSFMGSFVMTTQFITVEGSKEENDCHSIQQRINSERITRRKEANRKFGQSRNYDTCK